MLRWLVGVVLLLNVLFFAWSQYWLRPLGLGPLPQGEPERVRQQIRPEAVSLRQDVPQNAPPPAPAASEAASAPAAPPPS